MIVTSVQHIVEYVRDAFRTRIYKTINDPVTMKEIVTCEVYTQKASMVNDDTKGKNIDKKV